MQFEQLKLHHFLPIKEIAYNSWLIEYYKKKAFLDLNWSRILMSTYVRWVRSKNMCTIKSIEFIVMIIETNSYPWISVIQSLYLMEYSFKEVISDIRAGIPPNQDKYIEGRYVSVVLFPSEWKIRSKISQIVLFLIIHLIKF